MKSLTIPKLNNMEKQPILVCYENSAKDKDNLKTPFVVIEDTHDKENKTIVGLQRLQHATNARHIW